ncbi:uncharacterized protein LOC125286891 isoform X5 [Alosa alosa]|uniref:uncharacterized protein LOC125286891 isoform X5 n=1 Tax=Alosa alosa TaxID=278164 RepID=UPI0020151016|nr:uncharacterized protein LOC125286891 isoform X5 [Alosa alosa]
MESLSFILLVCLMIQCHGFTHFHCLQKGEEVTLSCGTCQWEADVDSDNRVDCTLSKNYSNRPECPAGTPDLCNEIKRNTSRMCDISVKRGFFACVNDFKSDSCFIYPFKPSAHHMESYIVAQEEPESKCEDLLLRRSNTSKPSLTDTNTHNLMISSAAHSDSGQYVCALQVNKNQQHWRVITNTTVTVGDPVKPGIYVAGVVVPIILIAVVIILLRRRSAGTKAPQTVIFQSDQHGEAEDDDECSPYAVSQREQEPMYSLIQLTEQKTDCSTSGDGELASKASGHKAIMKNNSIYETAGP